nr:hypothetical protein CFP56_48676 [Quercus suber]
MSEMGSCEYSYACPRSWLCVSFCFDLKSLHGFLPKHDSSGYKTKRNIALKFTCNAGLWVVLHVDSVLCRLFDPTSARSGNRVTADVHRQRIYANNASIVLGIKWAS